MKNAGFLLILCLLLLTPHHVSAQEALIIEEIAIIGMTRTNEQIIRNQLPFEEGDIWQEHYRGWALRRLNTLAIFAYEPLTIIVDPLSQEHCKITVRVADPSILYKDPAEFFFTTAAGLFMSEFTPTLYNPLGLGINVHGLINWSHNYTYGGRITVPLGSGLCTVSGRYYRNDRNFLNHNYQSQGVSLETGYIYWWDSTFRQTTKVQYHNFTLNNEEEEYLVPGLSFYLQDAFTATLDVTAGLSLQDSPHFWQAQGVASYRQGPFVGLVRGGLTSEDTPDNYAFSAGGFTLRPIRSEGITLNTGYALATMEYHHPLLPDLSPIGFMDCGWIWPHQIQDPEFLITLGLGIAYNTPLGMPVRLDVAINPMSGNFGWNIGLGHTFSAP